MNAARLAGVRAVLFDLDGTLIDSAPDLGAAADALRVQHGLPSLALEHYRPWTGSGARGMLKVAFGIEPGHVDFGVLKEAFYLAYEARLTQHTEVFAGVELLLERLVQGGLVWGIVTNKAERFTRPLIQALPLLQRAATVVSGDTTPHTKPHPAPLLEAAHRLALAPEQCIYVGDDVRDMQAGRAAGMRTVAAAYGYLGASGSVSTWDAHTRIDAPLELLNCLEIA